MDAKAWIVCSVGILYLSVCDGGYCTQYYSNSETCSHLVHYYTTCGWWSRCGRYRLTSYGCYKQRSRRVCCTGYQGQDCSQPICFGSTSCPNGGTCRAPDTCSCRAGFSGKKCSDDDECNDKTHSCDHNCTNEEGAYSCSCNMGYLLDIDNRTCSGKIEAFVLS
ncbi:notch homolog 2 N-terminal-like protein B [Mya arenaria]|uniref:notch homolog 2 N-terminal-like protein B n=1 Tax=Mya arenaria TaxID=6604 RepID=UPI0022E73850|nr:notch homolog 2 N-terminal-like protein B [Mya arenaria]